MQITHRTGTYYTETTPMLIWEATEDDAVIGELYVTTDTHEIAQIEVAACVTAEPVIEYSMTGSAVTHAATSIWAISWVSVVT